MPDWLAVGAGGVMGTFLRAWSTLIAAPVVGWEAWATVGGNLVGAFILGYVAGAFLRHSPEGSPWHLFLSTGVLGSFTTFSALAVDLLHFADGDSAAAGGLYLLLSIPGGIVAALLGLALGGVWGGGRPA
ncbi:MAG: CrcB family protein [Gemmatimonadota bacterium]